MKTLHATILDALVRIQRFLDANSAALGTVNTSGARTSLDAVVAQLSGHAADQGSHTISAIGQTKKQSSLRLRLRRSLMQPVVDMARANRDHIPDVADLRMPDSNMQGTQLVAAAEAMADAAAPYADVFVGAGLRPDFLDALRAGATALRDSLGVRAQHQNSRKGATIGLDAQAASARKAIRMLNAAVGQALADNTELLTQWKSIKRVPKKPGVARTPATTASPSAPAIMAASTPAAPVAGTDASSKAAA